MKLVRFGSKGSERPGLVDKDGKVRDLSHHVPDITGATLAPESLAKLRAVDPATFGDDSLRTVDPRTLAVGKPVKVGDEPCGLAVGAGSLWVEDYGSDQVTRVDVRNGRVEHTYRVGASPY